jgi:hypothetical protein
MYSIDACTVCAEQKRTVISEYNRFIFMDSMWQSDLARFSYALCHGCGLVYATRRPDRKEYDYLYENFGEFLMRKPDSRSFNQPQVSPDMAEEIDRDFLPWWEIGRAPIKSSIRKRLHYDLKRALHYLPYIMQHVPLEGAKVLHIRAKGSTLADMMKRLLGAAQVDLITLFPPYKYLADKNEGIRAQACLDYEDFKIPFDEKYDLIIANHVLLHMLDATRTFEVFKAHLEEGGNIFMIGELDDNELCRKGKNLFAELRPFHYQQFDTATVERILRRYGFEPRFVVNPGEGDPELLGIAMLTGQPAESPQISSQELDARISMYQQWRDESILYLPKGRAEALFGDELKSIWKRVEARGGLEELNKKGRPVAYRLFREAEVPVSELVIGPAFSDVKKKGRKRIKDAAEKKHSVKIKNKGREGVEGMSKDAPPGNWLWATEPSRRVANWFRARRRQRNKAGGSKRA